jgi:phosphoribosylformylglycinamidine synthase
MLLVVPRMGTISPWSSKATDIAKNCGLSNIKRIERGIVYWISGSTDKDKLKEALNDRMVETVLTDFDSAEALFSHAQPTPMSQVDIITGGREALVLANC